MDKADPFTGPHLQISSAHDLKQLPAADISRDTVVLNNRWALRTDGRKHANKRGKTTIVC